MSRYWTFGAGLGLLFGGVALMAFPTANAAPESGAEKTTNPSATPILIELFTSEGCSSCPPADAAMARLLRTQPLLGTGIQLVVLSHHVDYWNYIGWSDPFSSPSASDRQRSYARLGTGSGSYTPQAVIDGRNEVVGSREGDIAVLASRAAKQPHAKVSIEATERVKNAFDVVVRVSALPEGVGDGAEILLATVQDRAKVAVTRGENSGRTLEHVSIVREVRTIGPAEKGGSTSRASVDMKAPISAPDGTSFSLVAFVQHRSTRQIIGSSIAPLRAK